MDKEFQIEFVYQGMPYLGLVRELKKGKHIWYAVNLERENQETNLEIILKPSISDLDDWDFYCVDGDDEEDASEYYDKDLLMEIGEAIEGYLLSGDQRLDEG